MMINIILMSNRNRGWCESKHVQNGDATIPFDVNNGGAESSETFEITSAKVTGLCSIRRSKSASFNADKVIIIEKICIKDYIYLNDFNRRYRDCVQFLINHSVPNI